MSYSAVRDYVARRRAEIREEEGRGPARVFVPQHHPPGQDAEVDFGEAGSRTVNSSARMVFSSMAGFRVRCTLASKLANELGYMELDRRSAEFLFQVLTEREEKASVAIASNESFSKVRNSRAGTAQRSWFPRQRANGASPQPDKACS